MKLILKVSFCAKTKSQVYQTKFSLILKSLCAVIRNDLKLKLLMRFRVDDALESSLFLIDEGLARVNTTYAIIKRVALLKQCGADENKSDAIKCVEPFKSRVLQDS